MERRRPRWYGRSEAEFRHERGACMDRDTMNPDHSSGQKQTVWLLHDQMRRFAALTEDVTADVCVVGAGMAGLSTAYLLSREGRSVVVLEDGLVGSGETGRTTAHLSNAIDDRYIEIERLHGRTASRLVAESHTAAIERIQRTIQDENIACDFERLDGYLILSPEEKPDLLEAELVAAQRAGLTSVELLPSPPLAEVNRPCLRFPNQAMFHPTKYLAGLADALMRNGGRIYTETHATDITKEPPCEVKTHTGRTVRAQSVVVATNTPINEWVVMHSKQAPYRTYVVAAQIPRGSVPKGLYWDTQDPYHYVRLQRFNEQFDLLIIGGEDHKTGQAEDGDARHRRLIAWSKGWFPMLGAVMTRWSGQVMESVDGLGYIGGTPGQTGNVYLATGDSGMGMTHGTIASMLLTDLICGRQNPWSTIYDPSRLRPRSLSELASENVNVAAQYLDWLTPAEAKSPEEIAPGQGAVIRKGLRKLAVYRDADGGVHQRSAVCPHLRCIVKWNKVEQTWDCPCHGSRFDPYGKVLNGPANSDLPIES
jgi:glycine/D-amino acid oxidase-like deaminating enzyme/nitrite reductase/ring-hydroxylating ferredoxin subunit